MFEALMMFIQRTFLRSKIKKITKTDNIKHAKDAVKRASGPIAESHKKEAFKKVKSMLFKDKALTWGDKSANSCFLNHCNNSDYDSFCTLNGYRQFSRL